MNTKPLPIIVTLAACLISCVVSIVEGVGFKIFVARFALTALVFYVGFSFVRVFLDMGFAADKRETERIEREAAAKAENAENGEGAAEEDNEEET